MLILRFWKFWLYPVRYYEHSQKISNEISICPGYLTTALVIYIYIYFPKPSALREGRLHPCSYDFERNEINSKGRLDDKINCLRKVRRPLLQDGLSKFFHHSFSMTSWRRGRLTFLRQLFLSSSLPLLLFHFFRNRNCKDVVSPPSRPKVLGKYHTFCKYA